MPVIDHGRNFTTDLPTYLDSETARPDLSDHVSGLGVAEHDVTTRRAYVLLTTGVIHDVNLLRGVAGEPATPCHRTGLVPRPLRATATRLPRHGHAPRPTDR